MAVQAKNAMAPALLLSLLALAGCDKPADTPPKPTTAATAAPAAAPPYTPPTAEQLQQMVAPIALFPDKLVGQVLAGATYPAQITAADQWVDQNPSLKGDALQSAEANQPWDVSVKSLTAFPSVLDQMAGNIQWTTELGQAYANDPNDVMNAIQVMRVRAQQAGNLKSSPRLRVSTTVRAPQPAYVEQEIIPPPPQTIVIEPAEPDVVYVPAYNPAVVYGAPVPVYPGWVYREPAYAGSDLVTTGAITFGIGVLVGAAVSHHHHDWGWHSWGVNWGGPAYGGGWHRPAVVYNNTTYVTRSVTVNNFNYRAGPRPEHGPGPGAAAFAAHNAPPQRTPGQPPAAGPMSMPHFTHQDAVPGTRPPPGGTPAMVQYDFRQQPLPQHQPQMPQQRPQLPVRDSHGAPPAQAMINRPHADAGRERTAQATPQDRGAMPMRAQQQQRPAAPDPHLQAQRQQVAQERQQTMERRQAEQHQPAMQHSEAAMARQEMPHREPNSRDREREQARAIRQDVLAVHPRAERPQQQQQQQQQQGHPQPQAQHAERHEQAARQEKHDRHDRHG